nr:hypothetical protein [uncultured Helicobacter sp.]
MNKFVSLHLLFFTCICGVFLWIVDSSRISQEVLDLFPDNDNRALIEAHRHFANSKYVPLALRGFDESSKKRFGTLLEQVEQLSNVASILQYRPSQQQQLYDFLTHSASYLLAPDSSLELDSQTFTQTFMPILQTLPPLQDSHSPLVAKDYGFYALIELHSLEDTQLQDTLKSFKELESSYPDMRYFSPDFMRVENLGLILQEVNLLLGFASLVFIVLYFVILRIPLLTFHTICTLILANMVAILLVLCVYPKVTIMALSFGMGISNIAIDYMMHHHFFGLYAQKKATFNRAVFYGYITTMLGFGACLFIPFPLLAQLALYAMISLSIAYVSFAFIYPHLGLKPPKLFAFISRIRSPRIPSLIFLLLALLGFIYAAWHTKLDFDLSKLDYHNTQMLEQRAFFERTQNDVPQVLLQAKEAHGLMLFVRGLLANDSNITFNKKQGSIQDGYFYLLANMTHEQIRHATSLLNDLKTDSGTNLKLWSVEEQKQILESKLTLETRPLQKIMDSLADSIYQPMLIVLCLALGLMLLSLVVSLKKDFFHAASFVLFPLSVALCVIASHSEFNMMHLFALLILVVVSVDYGIYAIKEGENPRTNHAIIFSALTTGASFGILILSQTKALNSFGEVIFSGMCCMMILLVFGRFGQRF